MMTNKPHDGNQESSFRKRRLSLPSMIDSEQLACAVEPEENDEPHEQMANNVDGVLGNQDHETADQETADSSCSFRKRRLSLTTKSPDTKRPCLMKEAGGKEAQEASHTCTVHAGEILSKEPPTTGGPRWKHRLTVDPVNEVEKLPFAPHIVGTYSCHGIEPVDQYDDVNEEVQPDDEVTPLQRFFASGDLEDPRIVSFEDDSQMNTVLATTAKINQDRGGIAFPYGNSDRMALFAVYDGHGPGGEAVSQFSLNEVQRRLEEHASFPSDLAKALTKTFLSVDNSLRNEAGIDPLFAGSTACVALLHNATLTLANAGDSRAVCARRDASGSLSAIDLTFDQNPDVPDEMARIRQYGGFVSLPPEPGLSARVWLDAEQTQVGLAMARSLGDHAAATVGVIAEPVITTHTIQTNDEFMILATDGVWEFLDSKQVVDIVGNSLEKGASKACEVLIEAAANRWKEEEGAYRDDITAMVVKLQNLFQAPEPSS